MLEEVSQCVEGISAPSGDPTGGRTTISPPSKRLLQSEKGFALASGVDSLVLAVDLYWRDTSFFKHLDELRAEAASKECPMPGLLKAANGEEMLAFEVHPFGKEGYQWLITSAEYAIKLGNWTAPRSRPSAMIEIRSQTLWLRGVAEAVDRILTLLKSVGAFPKVVKASRIDLCVDVMMQATLWNIALTEYAVTRAQKTSFHRDGRKFTGVQYGKGKIVGRLYDKALEIATVSHKTWMFDIWNVDELPDELRVIRVEFQIRREVLKELALDTVWDFINHPRNLWAYCTHKWLKFTDDPEVETRFQQTLPFWQTVQEGFLGGQLGEPLIRAKAVNVKKKQIAQQLLGQLTSLIVIDSDEFAPELELDQQLPLSTKSAELIGMDDAALSERVRRKQGKYLRSVEKFKNAETRRRVLGLPVAIKAYQREVA